MNEKKQAENGKTWLKRETRPYGASIVFLTVLSVLSAVFSLAFAYMVRFIVNSATEKDVSGLFVFSVCLLGLLLLRILLKTLNGYFAEKIRAKMFSKLRTRMFSKILRADYAKAHEYHSGDLHTRLTSDIQEVVADTVGLAPTIAGMITQCVGSIAALLTLDWRFTLFYVICGSIFGGIAALFRKQLKKRHKAVLQADGTIRSYMQESLSSVLTLKAYGVENKSKEKADELSQEYYEKRMKSNVLRSLMNCVFSLLSNSGLILAVVLCSISVYHGNNDYGAILSIMLLLMQMQQPLTSFSSLIPVYYTRIASGERLAEIDELPEEPIAMDSTEIVPYDNIRAIDFIDVGFTYGREVVFEHANVRIEKGEIICLTGASGTGKSTIFKLLLSVYQPTEGEVRLCAVEENSFELLTAKQRGLFAYVPQGNFLFSGTIYENLTFFSAEKDATILREKVVLALKTACADFVFGLPEGLNTPLLENGGGLSEGQLQRLAVARALITDRPILLLDEATSALDGETENALLENIRNLSGKTCIIVTHRPAALAIADRILHIENGKISVQ